MIRIALGDIRSSQLVIARLILGAAVLTTVAGLRRIPLRMSWKAWLHFQLIQDVGPTTAAAVDYLVPVFAVGFGAVLLREAITWNVLGGGAVVLLGIGIAEGRLKQKRQDTGSAKSATCKA